MQQWGGIVINGFGVTNACSYEGRAARTVPAGHVLSRPRVGPSHYGGGNDADDSGILRYVIVKHTGSEVAHGDELNGISFNAVGSGTVVENLRCTGLTTTVSSSSAAPSTSPISSPSMFATTRSTIADGYDGTITNALVIHSAADGKRCIEADDIGGCSGDVGVPSTPRG